MYTIYLGIGNCGFSGSTTVTMSFSLPQPQIKTGIIVLQSWEEEDVHDAITAYTTNLITAVSEALWSRQREPPLPPNPQNYVGKYTAQVCACTRGEGHMCVCV
jgi:hypothetical protein